MNSSENHKANANLTSIVIRVTFQAAGKSVSKHLPHLLPLIKWSS